MIDCKHTSKVGDNYGISCMDCGAQLAGYGYYGDFPYCLHHWTASVDGEYLVCYYCQREMDNWGQSDEREDLYA